MRRSSEAVQAALLALDERSQRRQRRVVAQYIGSAGDARVVVDGQPLLSFCSNDYLGLARHPALASAAQCALAEFGTGAGAAHLVTGHSLHHHALEEELAAFTGRQRALLFSTGYMANLGVISALCERREFIVQDRLNHASLIDGARLSAARLLRYTHGDAAAAGRLLAEHPGAALLATDGVFSMDGDLAPLAALARHCRQHQSWLLVDDAHGLGVLGSSGGGTLQLLQLDSNDVPLLVGTLGKALGCFGAFVAGDEDVIELLLQRSRTYIYTTALPPAIAAATRAALQLCQRECWRRERLQEHIRRFRRHAAQLGLPLQASDTAIQPLMVGSSHRAVELSERLFADGFWVSAIRPPTVPEGTARLRITLCSEHRAEDLDRLLEAIAARLPTVSHAAAAELR